MDYRYSQDDIGGVDGDGGGVVDEESGGKAEEGEGCQGAQTEGTHRIHTRQEGMHGCEVLEEEEDALK